MNTLSVRRLFEGGHYYAQLWACAAPIRGRLLNGVPRLFDEIRYGVHNYDTMITSKRYSVGLAYPAARGIGAIGQL